LKTWNPFRAFSRTRIISSMATKTRRHRALLFTAWILAGHSISTDSQSVVKTEFLFETAPFASAHASTIVETREGLVAAWFGGTREGANDVGIWLSRQVAGTWTAKVAIATGVQPDESRYPCWNPVLFEMPDGLTLFYKLHRTAFACGAWRDQQV
jgi:hypothetical protein